MNNQLSYLRANKDRICLIHYACTDVSKIPIKIPCIVIAEYSKRIVKVFSVIEKKEEKAVLHDFYEYVSHNPNNIYAGWNFKDVTYGLPVIERRYTELFGKKPPGISLVFDLDDVIEELYGKLYVEHGRFGKMHNLFTLNEISTLNFLSGKKEAELCEKGDIRAVERSTACKVHGMIGVLDLLLNRRLKTAKTPVKWSYLRNAVHKAKNSTVSWMIPIIAAILTIISFLLGWIRW